MNVMDRVFEKARANPKLVAFPEVEEEKILLAAKEAMDQGICLPVIVGKNSEIQKYAEEYKIDLNRMQIFDCEDEVKLDEVIFEYTSAHPVNSVKTMKRKSKDSLYVALMLEALGQVDATFAGMSHTTGDVILAGQMVIGLQEGVTTVSSVGIANIPGYQGSEGELLVIGDSAVCANPSSEDLASIAISACDTAHSILGWEPRCALVSFSTTGSAEHELIDKANIIIWPDLNVGNIGVKLLQQFAHADAYGPVLQGFKKVVCDCSRSAPISEVVGNIAISVVRAQYE